MHAHWHLMCKYSHLGLHFNAKLGNENVDETNGGDEAVDNEEGPPGREISNI